MRTLTSLSVALLVVASLAAARTPLAEALLEWRPERPGQGHLFVVRIVTAPGTPVVSVEGAAAGEALHFTALPDGTFESLAPVPVDAEGSVAVSVDVRYAEGVIRRLEAAVPIEPGEYRHERLTVQPELGRPLGPEQQERLARDQARAREVSRRAHLAPRLWSGVAVPPRDARVTSGFGDGRIFNGQVSSRHLGLDLAGNPGDTVVAAVGGIVEVVDEFLLAGNIVYVNHGGGLLSGYFHLSRQLVSEGDTIDAGTPIGLVGATGRVTGPHLHWVVRYGATSVDPRSLLELGEVAPPDAGDPRGR